MRQSLPPEDCSNFYFTSYRPLIDIQNGIRNKKAPGKALIHSLLGGGAGIRTLDASFSSHTPLAGEPLQPLGHASKPRHYSSMTNSAFFDSLNDLKPWSVPLFPNQTPYAARARPAPYTCLRSRPKFLSRWC